MTVTGREARKKLGDALSANPQNFKTGGQFEKQPFPPKVLRLNQIEAPALVIVGEADIADVIAYAGAIEAALPIVFLEVWQDCGHLIQLEKPKELVARIERPLSGTGQISESHMLLKTSETWGDSGSLNIDGGAEVQTANVSFGFGRLVRPRQTLDFGGDVDGLYTRDQNQRYGEFANAFSPPR